MSNLLDWLGAAFGGLGASLSVSGRKLQMYAQSGTADASALRIAVNKIGCLIREDIQASPGELRVMLRDIYRALKMLESHLYLTKCRELPLLERLALTVTLTGGLCCASNATLKSVVRQGGIARYICMTQERLQLTGEILHAEDLEKLRALVERGK